MKILTLTLKLYLTFLTKDIAIAAQNLDLGWDENGPLLKE